MIEQTGGTFGSARLWYHTHMTALKRQCVLINKVTRAKFPSQFVIHEPKPEDNGTNYSCLCEITGAPDISATIFGIDGIQAVELSIRFLQTQFESLADEFDILYTDGTPMIFFSSPE
ncbi:MAG: hypothetical protein MUF19_04240 [Candidatus Pacebacteria bacterium]|jgi:hypothetical protein|nr:hypothetical protein [Candidatus Paceibacterota bacterium]